MRIDGRQSHQLRPVTLKLGTQEFAEGSCLIQMERTRVLCAVTVEDRVPPFLRGQRKGWVTAEYGMLPRSTQVRTPRESVEGRPGGRTVEIQRLIGRSLRAVTDLSALGEHTFIVDCDVLQADGGTRTAAITGGCLALYQAMHTLVKKGLLETVPMRELVAAVSAGVVAGTEVLDLCYEEDSRAEADFNIVRTEGGLFVEVQGTAEGKPFSRGAMDSILALAEDGLAQLFRAQREAIKALVAGG